MKKLKYLIFFISLNSLAVSFFNKDFNAIITEKHQKDIKEYKISYKKDEIKVEILSPKINKGEIYTYKNNKKYIYYPLLEQVVEQTYANSDNDIIFYINILKDIKKTTIKNGKKYIVEKDKIIRIESDSYKIYFNYEKDKISNIIFKSDTQKREYKWKY